MWESNILTNSEIKQAMSLRDAWLYEKVQLINKRLFII